MEVFAVTERFASLLTNICKTFPKLVFVPGILHVAQMEQRLTIESKHYLYY